MFRLHNLTHILSIIIFISIIVTIFMIFIIVFSKADGNLNLNFIRDTPKGFPIGSEGGVYPAIIGTLYFTLIACGFSFFFSLLTSIYLSFYCKNEYYKNLIHVIIGMLAGIPSIVLGLFGYSFLVVYLNWGISILSGGLVLGIMIFPYMELRFERIFRDINAIYKVNAYSLGVNTFYYILYIVIPLTWRDIVATVSLVSSMAMGASAPLLLTGAIFYAKVPQSIFSPAMALPLHLFHLVSESISIENAFATAALLLVILCFLNILTWLLSNWREEK